MSDNIRWLLALAAASVTIAVVVAARRDSTKRTRDRCILGVGCFLIAWAAAELPPFVPWTVDGWRRIGAVIDGASSPQVLVACAAYLGIAVASSRGLIGLPIYRELQARAGELRGIIDGGCLDEIDGPRLRASVDQAERVGARRIDGFVVSVPLPDVLGANRTLNGVEKQMLSALESADLRLAASQIAALLPASREGTEAATKIATAMAVSSAEPSGDAQDGAIRNAAGSALILLHRLRDVPQERDVNHIRVALWLTLVGLAATYALSVTFSGREAILVAGALGGLLGSLSALITNRNLSLGMVVLSPVAGALNAIGGVIIVGFLAQGQIALLGEAFANVWTDDGQVSLTALAVAILLGFSGGLFSRIAVAGTAPLLGTAKEDGTTMQDGTPAEITLVPPRETTAPPPGGTNPGPVAAEASVANGHGDRSMAREISYVIVHQRRARRR